MFIYLYKGDDVYNWVILFPSMLYDRTLNDLFVWTSTIPCILYDDDDNNNSNNSNNNVNFIKTSLLEHFNKIYRKPHKIFDGCYQLWSPP